MRYLPFFLFTAAVWAQPATPPPTPAPALPPDTLVATFDDGRKLTAGQLNTLLAVMPPNMQQAALHDRRAFVQQFALMTRLSEMAEKAKLEQKSPTRDALAFNRMYLLMTAQLHEVLSAIDVPPADAQAFYAAGKDRFKQVRVKAIYIPFSDEPKHLTEAEAQAKIAKLRAAAVAGEDFVKLVKDNSQDQSSVAKDGDFGTLRGTDNLPDAIRAAIFALKAGEISAPVKQPNGFYLFRAEEITPQPYAEVQDEILNDLRQSRFKTWMDDVIRSLKLKIENEAYFTDAAAPSPGK